MAQAIRVGGTGEASPLIQKLIEVYRKSQPDAQINLILPPLGSSGGMRALAAGRLDLAVSASPPKPEDLDKYAPPIPWLRSPFALAGRGVPEKFNLSRQQLADVYAGKISQWPDGSPIRLVLRPAMDSDSRYLRSVSPAVDAAVESALQRNVLPLAENDLDNLRMLLRTPGSLGTVSLGLLMASDSNSNLRPLSIDGVVPSIQSLQDGSYPLSKTLTLLTAPNPAPAVRAFVTFLRAPATLELVRRWSYVPVRP